MLQVIIKELTRVRSDKSLGWIIFLLRILLEDLSKGAPLVLWPILLVPGWTKDSDNLV